MKSALMLQSEVEITSFQACVQHQHISSLQAFLFAHLPTVSTFTQFPLSLQGQTAHTFPYKDIKGLILPSEKS